jgi:hypothetical protein
MVPLPPLVMLTLPPLPLPDEPLLWIPPETEMFPPVLLSVMFRRRRLRRSRQSCSCRSWR